MNTHKFFSILVALGFAGGLFVAGPALAITETESNDTPATANPLGVVPAFPSFVSADGELPDLDDVDFYSFILAVPSILLAYTLGDEDTDTTIALWNTLGTLILASNDDCSATTCDFSAYGLPGGGTADPFSALDPTDPAVSLLPGTYFISVAKASDVGSSYTLVVSSDPLRSEVPEPASLLLLGSGLAGLALWQRKRA